MDHSSEDHLHCVFSKTFFNISGLGPRKPSKKGGTEVSNLSGEKPSEKLLTIVKDYSVRSHLDSPIILDTDVEITTLNG